MRLHRQSLAGGIRTALPTVRTDDVTTFATPSHRDTRPAYYRRKPSDQAPAGVAQPLIVSDEEQDGSRLRPIFGTPEALGRARPVGRLPALERDLYWKPHALDAIMRQSSIVT